MAFAYLGDSARAWQLAGLINPIHHALDAQAVQRYKAEPYVLAADVYAVAPHTGRGGWSWYTGAAGWMYRLLTESLPVCSGAARVYRSHRASRPHGRATSCVIGTARAPMSSTSPSVKAEMPGWRWMEYPRQRLLSP